MNSKDLIAELEHELVSTEKLLHLVPAGELEWQPHPKAMALGQLANHVACIPGRYLTFAEEGNTSLQTLITHALPKSKDEILDNFKESRSRAMTLLNKSDSSWATKSWTLTKNGEIVFALPLTQFARLLVLNHLVHHRGQLSTYLRTLNISIPSIYGPSGDEDPFA